MARSTLDGYPTSMGDKRVSVFVHKGPASYVAVGVATPPTGGDVIAAAESGMKYFDFVHGDMTSDDGQFRVELLSPNGNTGDTIRGATPTTTMRMRWIVVATGAEVAGAVNLSARTVRLMAYGPR